MGKLLPYAAIGLFDVLLVTLVAVYWFEVPFLGSFPLLFVCSIIYLLSTLGLGPIVSTISQTQQQASMTWSDRAVTEISFTITGPPGSALSSFPKELTSSR